MIRGFVYLALLACIGLTPVHAYADDDDQEFIEDPVMPQDSDDAPRYWSNNPCQSGIIGEGITVNCNNALGVDRPQVQRFYVMPPPRIIIVRPPPRWVMVRRCERGRCWLVRMLVN